MSSVQVLAAAGAALASVAHGGNFVFHRSASLRDWVAANQFCVDKYGTLLASIHSQAENDRVYSLKQQNGDEHAWFAANDLAFEGAWTNVDGSAFNYAHWDAGQPDNNVGSQDCALMWQNGRWDDNQCDSGRFNFVCNAPAWIPSDTIASDTWILVHGVGHKNWHDAAAYCPSTLATVTSQQANDWMWTALQSRTHSQAWIGYSDQGQEGNWQWAAGNGNGFTAWLPNEPNNSGNREDCALFWGQNRWNDGDCTWTQPAFFCQLG